MPRYCAVKFCRNRGGAAAKQDNKRISFYPFPLHDEPRLQKWMDNMKRKGWTPSRHQYLCSEHFTEDCFDIRWGIRYLKTTAVPTMFPSTEDEDERKCSTLKRSSQPVILDINPAGFENPVSKRPLILSKSCKKLQSSTTSTFPAKQTESIHKPVLVSDIGTSCDSSLQLQNPSEVTGAQTTSCITIPPCKEEQIDSVVTVLCCKTLAPHSNGDNRDAASLQAALSQTFSLIPVEILKEEPSDLISEEKGPSEEEHISVYEHTYCRPDTDKDQLWSKIISLNAKISELERREESTVAKIRALETEISLLKKDGAVFKEKHKVLEDFILGMHRNENLWPKPNKI